MAGRPVLLTIPLNKPKCETVCKSHYRENQKLLKKEANQTINNSEIANALLSMDSYVPMPMQPDIAVKTGTEPSDSDSVDSSEYPVIDINFDTEEHPRKKMKVTDLQTALREAGLDAHGTKAALSARLLTHKINMHKMPLAALTDVLLGDLDNINQTAQNKIL